MSRKYKQVFMWWWIWIELTLCNCMFKSWFFRSITMQDNRKL